MKLEIGLLYVRPLAHVEIKWKLYATYDINMTQVVCVLIMFPWSSLAFFPRVPAV